MLSFSRALARLCAVGLAAAIPAVASAPADAAVTRLASGQCSCQGFGLDAAGNLLVADANAGRLLKFDPSGRLMQAFYGGSGWSFGMPHDSAALPDGNIVVTDRSDRALVMTANGEFVRRYDGWNGGGVAITPQGRVFLTGAINVESVDSDGANATTWYGSDYGWKRPEAVAYNPVNDHVYVLDTQTSRVFELTQAGAVVRTFGSIGDGFGELSRPSAIAADASGALYVTQPTAGGNARPLIKKFSPQGVELGVWEDSRFQPNRLAIRGGKLYATAFDGVLAIDLDRPIASIAGAAPVKTSQELTFDASGSSQPFGGVTRYEWDLDGDGSFETDTGSSPKASRRFVAAGTQTVRLRVTGSLGGTDTAEVQIPVAPSAAAIAVPAVTLTGTPVPLSVAASALPNSEITNVAWDLDGNGSFEVDTGTSTSTSTSFPAVGSYTVGVRITRSGGVVDEARANVAARLLPPAGRVGVSINGGALYTNTPKVTLDVAWPAFSVSTILSNDGGFAGASVSPVAPKVAWTLSSSGPERLPKTVYLRFDGETKTFQDDIILDETPPTLSSAQLVPTAGVAAPRAKKATKKRSFRVKVAAKDKTSGVAKVQLAVKKGKPLPAVKYKKTVSVKSATAPKYVRVQDGAGNFSKWKALKAGKKGRR